MQTEASLERDTEIDHGVRRRAGARCVEAVPVCKDRGAVKAGDPQAPTSDRDCAEPEPRSRAGGGCDASVVSSTRGRRFTASTWGSRTLMALMLFGGQQVVLVLLWILSSAYTHIVARPASVQTGYSPPFTRFAVIFLSCSSLRTISRRRSSRCSCFGAGACFARGRRRFQLRFYWYCGLDGYVFHFQGNSEPVLCRGLGTPVY